MFFVILLIPKVAKIKVEINTDLQHLYSFTVHFTTQLITNLEINYCTNFTELIPCRSIQRIMAIFSGVES